MEIDLSTSAVSDARRSTSGRLWALCEGWGWLVLYQVAQLLALALLLTGLLHAAFGWNWPGVEPSLEFLMTLNLEHSFVLVGTSSLGSLFLILPLVWVRLGRNAREYLQIKPLHRDQVVFGLATILPVAVLGDALHRVAETWWMEAMATSGLSDLWLKSGVHHLHETFAGVPFFVLVVAVALGPAIGEELVFRGVVGNRLISAWGVPGGVLLTSLLFGLAHVSPPHALATIPIAVVAHLMYLHCRTIWAPILLHFGNNLLAVTLSRFPDLPPWPASPGIVCAALAYLGLLTIAWYWNDRLLKGAAGMLNPPAT